MGALAAVLFAALAGFAAQRGSVCAVAAVGDLVNRRNPRRFIAFFECALWSLALLAAASAVDVRPAQAPPDYAPGLLAAAGGAVFGLGAAINGACAFGTVARLGRGELAFLAMPLGFMAGAAIVSQFFDGPRSFPDAGYSALPQIAVWGIVFFVGSQLFRALDSVRSPAEALRRLKAPEWHPSFAMAAIGLSSALLMIAFAPWPYSAVLLEIGARAEVNQLGLRLLLAALFLIGAGLAARLAGTLKVVTPDKWDIAEKAFGGALMGAGAFLIPGGNDALVLTGLPHLFGYAAIAYAAMAIAIAAALIVRKRMK